MESVLYNFQNNSSDGIQPMSNLIFDHFGNMYGTTLEGGTTSAGTVYELTPSGSGWTEQVLSGEFNVNNNTGEEPWGGVIFGNDGNLYGTTSYGNYYGDNRRHLQADARQRRLGTRRPLYHPVDCSADRRPQRQPDQKDVPATCTAPLAPAV